MLNRFAYAMAALCFAHAVYASNDTNIGRYMTVINKPTAAQTDLLSQIIQVRFSQNIQTVGNAMNYLLKFSGYELLDVNKRSIDFQNTLAKPLPTVDRDFGPMPLKDALITLIGPAFNLKQDILNRTIDFTLKPQFKKEQLK